jgi:Ammonium Transporter Family
MTERAGNQGPAVATKPPATLAPRTLVALAIRYRWMPLAVLALLAVGSLAVMERQSSIAGGKTDLGDTAWLLTATGLVLLMTPGLSFFYAGMVSTKNVISTMLQSSIVLGVSSLLWVLVGFSVSIFSFFGSLILFRVTDWMIPIRVPPEQEAIGLTSASTASSSNWNRCVNSG